MKGRPKNVKYSGNVSGDKHPYTYSVLGLINKDVWAISHIGNNLGNVQFVKATAIYEK